jgi:hypothetical protein
MKRFIVPTSVMYSSEALFRGFELWEDAGRVVCAELLVAYAAGPGADGIVGGFEADGFEARWVVRADWGGDHVEESGAGGANAQCALGADHGGAEVEGVALFGGDEAGVELAEFAD